MVGYARKAHVKNKRNFVERFMRTVKLSRPVLVSASTSGPYALPFVMRPSVATCTERVRGFVAISPAKATQFTLDEYFHCKVSFTQQ